MTQAPATGFSYQFDGTYQPEINIASEKFEKDREGRPQYPYVCQPGLLKAVELAIALKLPLLLEGEPGCGKTKLASALAYELTHRNYPDLNKKDPENWWPFYIWNVKSTSQARDGLYQFDAIGRLRDAQLVGSNPSDLHDYLGDEATKLKNRLLKPRKYLAMQALGKAMQEPHRRPVVLIDEIDKADREFPNDLLGLLDQMEYEIPELDVDPVKAQQIPILILTSNREKSLPDPFLRRCIYFYVEYPGKEQILKMIAKRHGKSMSQEAWVNQAVERYEEIRGYLKNQPGLRQPGVSEFLDFLRGLLEKSAEEAIAILQNLAKKENASYLGLLLKSQRAQDQIRTTLP